MALKILTVDDSKTIRMIVKKAFKPFDCDLCEAENGVEGLVAATREKPDLIILDITMPVMNGIEMLKKLKGEPSLNDIPVIMLTAESGKDNVMQIVKMGVKDYVVKPFKGEQLIDRAKNIVTLLPKKTDGASEANAKKYFSVDEDIQILIMPESITKKVAFELESCLKPKSEEMAKANINKFILNLQKVTEISLLLVKLIMSII